MILDGADEEWINGPDLEEDDEWSDHIIEYRVDNLKVKRQYK